MNSAEFDFRFLYDQSGAARMLSTSERRVDEPRRAGRLIAVQDGREWKYTPGDLQLYVRTLKTADQIEAE